MKLGGKASPKRQEEGTGGEVEMARGHRGEVALGPPGWRALPGGLRTASPAEPHHLGSLSRMRPPGTHLQFLFPVFIFL